MALRLVLLVRLDHETDGLDGVSVSSNSARSFSAILPSASTRSRSHWTSPPQYSVPTSTTGNEVTFRVCTRQSASNNSSNVPKPPGSTMNPCAYFTNIVLRAKK